MRLTLDGGPLKRVLVAKFDSSVYQHSIPAVSHIIMYQAAHGDVGVRSRTTRSAGNALGQLGCQTDAYW